VKIVSCGKNCANSFAFEAVAPSGFAGDIKTILALARRFFGSASSVSKTWFTRAADHPDVTDSALLHLWCGSSFRTTPAKLSWSPVNQSARECSPYHRSWRSHFRFCGQPLEQFGDAGFSIEAVSERRGNPQVPAF
jgi:hypothetical protein